MNERPIIFSGPMVRAILDGRKTQTRRVMKHQPANRVMSVTLARNGTYYEDTAGGARLHVISHCPYGQPGDRLWVRETFAVDAKYDNLPMRDVPAGVQVWCMADEDVDTEYNTRGKWRPSIFMPRWACRIRLEVTGVKVERLCDISSMDVLAEGVPTDHSRGKEGQHPFEYFDATTVAPFRELWDSINAKSGYGWDANPWVWAITFRRVEA